MSARDTAPLCSVYDDNDETHSFRVSATWTVDGFDVADGMRQTLSIMGDPEVAITRVMVSGRTEEGW